MNLPNFICAGAQKAGTTSLYNILKQHSQIFLSDQKELHFFDQIENFKKGIEWYSKNFNGSKNYSAIGEITPNYMFAEEVPKRIMNTLGDDIKFIFMLRNPAERAFSHYKMRIARGFEKNSFKEAVNLELIELQKDSYSLEHKYINRGFYDEQIKPFLELFKTQNLFFMIFEDDFISNREKTMNELFHFLGVDSNESIAFNIKSNPGTFSKNKQVDKILNTSHPLNRIAKRIIPNKKTRTNIKSFFSKMNQQATADRSEFEDIKDFLIKEIFSESIKKTEQLINRDLTSWYK